MALGFVLGTGNLGSPPGERTHTHTHTHCHQRYVEREHLRKKREEATIYPGVEIASDDEANDAPIQVFVH